MATTKETKQIAVPIFTEAPVSFRPIRVTCQTCEGQTLHGFTVTDPLRADAILQDDVFRFGIITSRGDDYLLTQGGDTWRFSRETSQIVMFNLLPEYRAMIEQQFHQIENEQQ